MRRVFILAVARGQSHTWMTELRRHPYLAQNGEPRLERRRRRLARRGEPGADDERDDQKG
jgi:hypothetical protein